MVLFHLPLLFLVLLLPYPPLCTASIALHASAQEHSPLRGPSSLAAAEPVLRDRPFVVVWNMPTARCHRHYGVHLDLRDFDIVHNQQQHFQGQEMTIFYRNHLGKYPYLSHDGRLVNGGLPQLGDLAGHLSLAESQISNLLRPNFTGLAVIDWEEWRPLWKTDFGAKRAYRRLSKALVRQERPELPEEEVRATARRQFDTAARYFMEATLSLGVTLRPGGLWGYYGFPYCYNQYRRETGDMYTGQCHPRARARNDRLAWLWRQSTALYPSIYLSQEMTRTNDTRHMVKYRLLEALRVASRWRHGGNGAKHATPVLPYARLAFRHTLDFLDETDLESTLGESAALGAAGVVLWGELTFAKSKHQCELLRDYIHSVLGRYIRALRSDTQRCSLRRCLGNGRCVRRDPNSRHMISSASSHAMNTGDDDVIDRPSGERRTPFHKHFRCHCYRGWSGKRCDERKEEEDEGL